MENQQIQLIKKQESFDLIITDELESKIRFLCSRLPRNEYSGTLFYSVEGSFKHKDLKIIAKDFFLQDVGEATFTEFQNNVELAGYIAAHELWDCYIGLLHSHNVMSTGFSGTDINTLRSEGNDNNHFLSLIVNNAGNYTAYITKKVTSEFTGDLKESYNSFNDEHVEMTPSSFERRETYIEYYPLNIIMPEAAPKSELELRLEEVKANANSYINRKCSSVTEYPYKVSTSIDKIVSINKSKETPKEASLFSEKEMGNTKTLEEEVIDYDSTYMNPTIINNSIKQIITGDIFAPYKQNLDIDKWANNMENLYNKRFGNPENENFKYWVDSMLDFLCGEVNEETIAENGEDYMWAVWAYKVIVKLEEFPQNKYLEVFINSLNRWLI